MRPWTKSEPSGPNSNEPVGTRTSTPRRPASVPTGDPGAAEPDPTSLMPVTVRGDPASSSPMTATVASAAIRTGDCTASQRLPTS
ncbi:hypothetical protein OHA72_37105 [Dactylosporangium sp. NBC_01737]|uniref:hypothetical protein n=1 Tax=Dactylosporangium sp. NBC_01737 TaxID=2975959 RepID=UPI002E0E2E99|nr:hypothetical protein OHA72_37105 [Dactylosporangium sp. NBC_01737]